MNQIAHESQDTQGAMEAALKAAVITGKQIGRQHGLMHARTIISRMQQWKESTRVQDAALAEAIRAIEEQIAE